MANFRHDMFPPRIGIEDVIIITAWNRVFVLGNIGFSFGHSQPFIGEVTSRVFKHRGRSDVHKVEGGRHTYDGDVAEYEREWLPTVDDPRAFGLKEGNPAKNNPHRVEKNWNAFPCHWQHPQNGSPREGGVEVPVFVEGEQTSSPHSQSTILCLQRNIAPRVETFAYDLRRHRVIQSWESPINKYTASARGGKGVVRIAMNNTALLASPNQPVPTVNMLPIEGWSDSGGVMLTLAHNAAASSHYGLTWLLQRTESPFRIVAVMNGNGEDGGGIGATFNRDTNHGIQSFSMYRHHFTLLGKTSVKAQLIDAEVQERSQQGNINENRRRNNKPPDIKPTRAPTLVEFVKSISRLGTDWIVFSHSVEDDSSILCVAAW